MNIDNYIRYSLIKEDVCQPEAEQTAKKKKKKKKKSKAACEEGEQAAHNALVIRQEGPRFEVNNLIIV